MACRFTNPIRNDSRQAYTRKRFSVVVAWSLVGVALAAALVPSSATAGCVIMWKAEEKTPTQWVEVFKDPFLQVAVFHPERPKNPNEPLGPWVGSLAVTGLCQQIGHVLDCIDEASPPGSGPDLIPTSGTILECLRKAV